MIGPEALIVIVLSSLLSAGAAVFFIGRRWPPEGAPPADAAEEVVFLFDGRRLSDATPAARELLPPSSSGMDDWGRFLLAFGGRFANLETMIAGVDCGHGLTLNDTDDAEAGMTLQVQRRGGLTRIMLADKRADGRSQLLERYSLMALRAELETLRSIAEESPVPTWRRQQDGTIIWANSAYMALAQRESGPNALFGWPPPDLFGTVDLSGVPPDTAKRVSIPSRSSDKPLWFDMVGHAETDTALYFATPIDGLVRAEGALSGFVQTLTKTFAHLTVGLAIFDRKRRLVLFNPALIDLTGLPPEQLSTQPTLHSFLDALRDRQRIPEPKDYKSWRLQIAQLEAAAADGTYAQNWHLPSGQTYRVTGRPHPDGAVAYLFEDISSEVSLNRSFRSEIETGRAVLDNLPDAVAVFAANGMLTVANQAYAQLWQVDHGDRPAQISMTEALTHWASRSARPDDSRAELARILIDDRSRRGGVGGLTLPDGRRLACTVSPLPGGAAMVVFREGDDAAVGADTALLSRVGT
jgi:PAS domain-containing protein